MNEMTVDKLVDTINNMEDGTLLIVDLSDFVGNAGGIDDE